MHFYYAFLAIDFAFGIHGLVPGQQLISLATSITRLTLSQVTTDEIDAATKLLDTACQKLRGISDVPPRRITDLETAIRQHVN